MTNVWYEALFTVITTHRKQATGPQKTNNKQEHCHHAEKTADFLSIHLKTWCF